MIMVDIYIVSIDKTYDFNLDEDTNIEVLTEEISEMVSQKERVTLEGKSDNFYLCSKKDQRILPKNLTLRKCHIRNGDCLFMI